MLMQKHTAENEGYKYVSYDDGKNYQSSDFDCAVTLVCKGYPLLTIDTEDTGKLVFVFKDDDNIKSIVDGYWSNKITVNPLEFASVRKNLKSRIYGMTKRY